MKTQKTILNILVLTSLFAVVAPATAGFPEWIGRGKEILTSICGKAKPVFGYASKYVNLAADKAVAGFDRVVGKHVGLSLTEKIKALSAKYGKTATGLKAAGLVAGVLSLYLGYKVARKGLGFVAGMFRFPGSYPQNN